MDDVERALRERLATLTPIHLEVVDESAKHAGHAGTKGGGKHYCLQIVSEQFAGKSTLQRHRLIYDTLDELMRSKIHALSIQAIAPGESA
jgi:BolA protein